MYIQQYPVCVPTVVYIMHAITIRQGEVCGCGLHAVIVSQLTPWVQSGGWIH